ncbi:MAG: hypothetical protein EOP04_18990 [Proteobacteria bacterium]|nr:MAG: hypothetical protein EOP04_18990 [Pseudomonadota bacterium]
MRKFFVLVSIVLHFHCAGQDRSCIREDLQRIKVPAYLKGLPIADTQSVSFAYFKNGVELRSANPAAKITGYRVITECPSSDFGHFYVCGARMDSTDLKRFLRYITYPQKDLVCWFESINIEVDGRRFLVPGFAVKVDSISP